MDVGIVVVPIVFEDVRFRADEFVNRIDVQTRALAAQTRYVPGPMLLAGRVRRSCTYSAGAPAISAASAITPR